MIFCSGIMSFAEKVALRSAKVARQRNVFGRSEPIEEKHVPKKRYHRGAMGDFPALGQDVISDPALILLMVTVLALSGRYLMRKEPEPWMSPDNTWRI